MRYRSRWLDLMAMTRVLGAVVAVLLLMVHDVSDHDGWLIIATVGWTSLSLAPTARPSACSTRGRVGDRHRRRAALVYLSTDWRSPFYVFALTRSSCPATELPFRARGGVGR